MIRRQVIETAGYFNEKLAIYEDYDLLTRIALEGPFVVNCYVGVCVQRRQRRMHISELYQNSKIRAFHNLVNVYSNLKRDKRLASIEYKKVCRALSGVRYELAIK